MREIRKSVTDIIKIKFYIFMLQKNKKIKKSIYNFNSYCNCVSDSYFTLSRPRQQRIQRTHTQRFIKSGERFKQQFLFRSIGFSSLTMSHPFNQINVNPFNQLIEQLMINGHRLENNCRFVDVFWGAFRYSIFPQILEFYNSD